MTLDEFSNIFTTLLNSYNTQAQFGESSSKKEIVLDEYEKSVLLTQAQDIIVKSYFDNTLNSANQGFDDSTRRQIDFSSLIKVAKKIPVLTPPSDATLFDSRSILVELPYKEVTIGELVTKIPDVLFILNEKLEETLTVIGGTKTFSYVVVPISYKEYDREMSKPYAQPLKKQVWRLFQNNSNNFDLQSEIIIRNNIQPVGASNLVYKIRYIRRPRPIILEDLPNYLNIDGVAKATECELNPILHNDILNKAVELAIVSRGGSPIQVSPQNK